MGDSTVTAMSIISYAGQAKSLYLQALELVKYNNVDEAKDKLELANESLSNAHKTHYENMINSINKEIDSVSILMVHAEDQLMHAETIKFIVTELIDIYKKGDY